VFDVLLNLSWNCWGPFAKLNNAAPSGYQLWPRLGINCGPDCVSTVAPSLYQLQQVYSQFSCTSHHNIQMCTVFNPSVGQLFVLCWSSVGHLLTGHCLFIHWSSVGHLLVTASLLPWCLPAI
ncbi:unnamed protein product, partial [Lymnaea stagnalis]